MNKCRTTRKNQHCGVEVVQEPSRTPCDPINVCLGFGRSLVWSGNCPEVRGTTTISDGWYGQVHVVDGCIVDARDAQIPVYTPAPCAPAASPCDDGGSSSVTLNPAACNLLTFTSGMLDARLHFGDSTGVTITGCGTANDPLRFSVEVDGGSVFVKSGSPQVIGVEGDGSMANPFTISLANGPLDAGWHGAYEIDMYGRVIGFDATRTGLIEAVNDGDGIELKVESGILTANLKDVNVVAGQYTTGGYTYTVNSKGQVTNIRRDITIDEDTYQLGSYNVTVNAYGSITRIEPVNVDNSAIPDTFVGSFRGQSGSADTEREMTFTTELDGPLHVEYRGLLGRTDLDPGMAMTFPSGYSIAVDGIMMTDPLIEVVGVFTSDGVGGNAIVAIRATTMNAVAAGQHTITINAPTATITQRDGFMRAQIVGRGA